MLSICRNLYFPYVLEGWMFDYPKHLSFQIVMLATDLSVIFCQNHWILRIVMCSEKQREFKCFFIHTSTFCVDRYFWNKSTATRGVLTSSTTHRWQWGMTEPCRDRATRSAHAMPLLGPLALCLCFLCCPPRCSRFLPRLLRWDSRGRHCGARSGGGWPPCWVVIQIH